MPPDNGFGQGVPGCGKRTCGFRTRRNVMKNKGMLSAWVVCCFLLLWALPQTAVAAERIVELEVPGCV